MNIHKVQCNICRLSGCRSFSCGSIKFLKDLLLMGTAKTSFSFPGQTPERTRRVCVHTVRQLLSAIIQLWLHDINELGMSLLGNLRRAVLHIHIQLRIKKRNTKYFKKTCSVLSVL